MRRTPKLSVKRAKQGQTASKVEEATIVGEGNNRASCGHTDSKSPVPGLDQRQKGGTRDRDDLAAERTTGQTPKARNLRIDVRNVLARCPGPNTEVELSKSRKMKLSNLPASFDWKPRNLHSVRSPSRAGNGPFGASKGITLARSASELDRQPLSHEVGSICGS